MTPKYLLIVKVASGLIVRDTPRSETQGARRMRAEQVGKAIYAEDIHNIDGVEYARLVPQNPLRPEWVRVAEADRSIQYVDVIPLGPDSASDDGIARALHCIAEALEKLAK